jgi:hypothetical protein
MMLVQQQRSWRNIPITLINVNAFHEKAGRSQVGSFVFSLGKVFSPGRVATVATLPSALLVERLLFARCKLGVLVSVGAAT